MEGAFGVAVTIKDVSAKCGLSISTVSKAFNNYSDISAQTRELVQRTAQEIGYFPNAIARTLKTNRSYNIGVLFSEDNGSGLTHHFFVEMLDAFKTEAERRGYDITFINHNVAWTGMTYLEHCRYRNVDGVCLVCGDFYDPEVAELACGEIPCVSIDYTYANHSSVMSENEKGMHQLAMYAVAKGHRKIALVCGHPTAVTECRRQGFARAMSEAGIEVRPEYLREARYDHPGESYKAMMALMALADPPTCVLMPDDHSSLGALAAAELGLRVPQDVSIGGYDGIYLTQMIHPRLTTIRQDSKRMGALAAMRLIDHIEKPETTAGETMMVPGEMIEGESIGTVPPEGTRRMGRKHCRESGDV